TPLGFATGTLTVKSSPLALELADTTVSFSGVFRNPFAISVQGRPRRGEDAFYLVDGEPVPVKQDERAVGWPTVRFEITFKECCRPGERSDLVAASPQLSLFLREPT